MGRGDGSKTLTGGGNRTRSAGAASKLLELSPEMLRKKVFAEALRVADQGNWPPHISLDSLTERVPTDERPGSGFDAGIACALDLIPRPRQALASTLHAAYTPAAVAQVRREAPDMHPDSATAWWLAACSVCEEGRLSPKQFSSQLERFEELRGDDYGRREVAIAELQAMRSRYELLGGIPFSVVDGGMQGAYLDGHPVAVMHAPDEDLYFVGTYEPSLGLEDFAWSDAVDDLDRPRSGPVHGSRQFVKCADKAELERVLEVVKRDFGL
jgi:hypothetical protein